MVLFFWGLLIGIILTGGIAGAFGLSAHRRTMALERRATQSERLAELGSLTSGLAHELKNPLSTISLNLQLLREDAGDLADGKRLLRRMETVQNETNRLRDILNDFLRYGGKMEVDPHPTDLNELVQDLGDFFTPQAQFQKVQLRVRPAGETVRANIDPKLLKQAVLNLMINAVHAMSETGGELILSVSRSGNKALIDVIDTGIGIPADVQARIFQAYFTQRSGGTGLGLALTQRIVEAHEGAISVRSEPGKGSDFTIELPLLLD